ncbi:Ac81 [Mauternbach virus]|uniref:Ac81 n=1 Tax=Mauternbach virus TaxID=2486603 RepID=A0A3G3E844_9VIRU|nr:Ac81 [Mauternbach virus]AYP97968.1 Ac81 [Mauternbach virus]
MDEHIFKNNRPFIGEVISNDDNNNNNNPKLPDEYFTIEVRCQAMRKTFGLFDHYFIVVNGYEYHSGWYRQGKILKHGTTKGSHLISIRKICNVCYYKMIAEFYVKEDLRIFNAYFPFINCETICMGISVQSLLFLTIPFICVFVVKGCFLYALIFLLISIVCVLIYSKYQFSRTTKTKCNHLR